jgi:hypothetical protein
VFQLTDKFSIDANPVYNNACPASYINDTPASTEMFNCEYIKEYIDDCEVIAIKSIRDISRGEELFAAY